MRKFDPRKDAETSGVFKFPADSHADAVVLYHSEDFTRVIESNLFEWSLRAGISVPFCPEYQLLESDLRPVESVLEPEFVRLRMLEDMVQYYRSRPVNDDDLELISSVMSRAYDYIEGTDGSSDAFRSERFAPLVGAYERSLVSLEAHNVLFDPEKGVAVKYLEGDFGKEEDAGRIFRTWAQISTRDGSGLDCESEILDENARGPFEHMEEVERKETLRRLLNSLNPTQRLVFDFRFGLSDGYGRTLDEVGRLFNISREEARQIEADGLRKLRASSSIEFLICSGLAENDCIFDRYDVLELPGTVSSGGRHCWGLSSKVGKVKVEEPNASKPKSSRERRAMKKGK